MHNKMYKAGMSSKIQIVSGQKMAVYTLGFVYVWYIHVYNITKNNIHNDLNPKYYYNYQTDIILNTSS